MSSDSANKPPEDHGTSHAPVANPPSGSSPRMGLWPYLKSKRNEILAGTIGAVLIPILVGTALAMAQEWLKSDRTAADLVLKERAVAVFPKGNSSEMVQILAYDLTATDLLKKVKVTAIFKQHTEVINLNVIYSVDISGFESQMPHNNHLILELNHPLDLKKGARIYMYTRRGISATDQATLELPDIHVEAEDKNGRAVYR